ncbi:MAG: glycosyltransferase family 4 protein [Candidatus Liptonbacteria bacterium]|nr:glycosyltransferase family 4 protein [Candidatus Liptonbacteria bacterium]
MCTGDKDVEKKPLKIGIVHLDLSHPMGDTYSVACIAQGLRRLGHEVSVWTPVFDAGPFADKWKGLELKIIPSDKPLSKVLEYINSPNPLKKIIGRLKVRRWSDASARAIAATLPANLDVLDCHNWYAYRAAKYYRSRNPSCRIVWIMHDMPSNYRAKKNPVTNILSWLAFKLEPLAEKDYYRYVDEVIVMDKHSIPIAAQCGKPVALLYLGLDYPHFEQPVKIRDEFKKGQVTLLGVGALSPYRRYEDIVSAVSILRKNGIKASAMIVCRDAWGNPGYRKSFDEFVESSNAAPYITINYEGVSAEGLLETFRATDIFVFPNDIEIWGMAAFEAMAAGMPLIVSNVTSAAMYLKERNGAALFVDPRRPEQIAAAAEKLINDRELYLKMAKDGQKFVKENLSWGAYAKGFLDAAFKK